MQSIKSYTDIEQSKKLAEILPLDSADMFWQSNLNSSDRQYLLDMGKEECFDIEMNVEHCGIGDYDIPAWSLTTLLCVLPILERKGYQKAKPQLLYDVTIHKWIVDSHILTTDAYDNPIDACYEMILILHKLNLL